MLNQYDEICDSLDACVFSGLLVMDKANRDAFKQYLERWTREVELHESMDVSED